jgi:pantoate--beta-alanine ligase
MEGAQRPGHFDGVAQVVKRLLDIVEPTHMYMGEKDYQQLLIVRSMVNQLDLPVEVVGCPIVREPDGLAMSSRNQRLSETERQQALAISKTLSQAAEWASTLPPEKVEQQAMGQLKTAGLAPEYFILAHAENLQRVQSFEEAKQVIAFVAARSGDVRLIDNRLIKG